MIRFWRWSRCLVVCRWLCRGLLSCSIIVSFRYWFWVWSREGFGRRFGLDRSFEIVFFWCIEYRRMGVFLGLFIVLFFGLEFFFSYCI